MNSPDEPDPRVRAIAAAIARLVAQRSAPTRPAVAKITGFTVRRVDKHWGAAMVIADAQRRAAQRRTAE